MDTKEYKDIEVHENWDYIEEAHPVREIGGITFVAVGCLLVWLLSWILPGGQFQVDDMGHIIFDSFKFIGRNPLSVWDLCVSPYAGLNHAIGLISYIIGISILFGMMRESTVWNRLVSASGNAMENGYVLLVLLSAMLWISVFSSIMGLWEELLLIIPLLSGVMHAIGYNKVHAVGACVIGAVCGLMGGILNPFSTGLASDQLGISLLEGAYTRCVIYGISIVIGMLYVSVRFIKDRRVEPKLQIESHKSVFFGFLPAWRVYMLYILSFLPIAIILLSMLPWDTFGTTLHIQVKALLDKTIVFGSVPLLGEWGMADYSATFVAFAFMLAVFGLVPMHRFVSVIFSSINEVLEVILIISMGMGIQSMLVKSNILWTLVYGMGRMLTGCSVAVFIVAGAMLLVLTALVLPSSSGLAVAIIPLLGKTAMVLGVEQSVVVTLLQIVYPVVMSISPGSPVLVAVLNLTKISYSTWLEYIRAPITVLFLSAIFVAVLAYSG